jgi:DNA-binding transcriptional LysR family regulator
LRRRFFTRCFFDESIIPYSYGGAKPLFWEQWFPSWNKLGDGMTPELLRDVAVFVEVAKGLSFSKAATALGLPRSTVSRRIADLEREAGLRLFTRSTQRVALTEEGMQYFIACRRMIEDAEAAYEQLQSARQRPRGALRIAATVDFGHRLVAGLPDFCQRYPELNLEFDFTTRRVDPQTDNCDVAIHVGVPADSSLTARKLADVAVSIYASPGYLLEAGHPASPADLSKCNCILEGKLYRIGVQTVWTLTNSGQTVEVDVHGTLSLNSIGIIRRLAVEGAGFALLPESLCRDDIQAGRLVPVLPAWRGPVLPIYALMATRLIPAKTRVFLDFVQSVLV